MTLLEDDHASDITDDYQQQREGPLLGFVGILRGRIHGVHDWDLKATVAYGRLENEISERERVSGTYLAPYGYQTDAYFLDLSWNMYLPVRKNDVQVMIGYKGQWDEPDAPSLRVVEVDQTGNEISDGESELRATQGFEADGLIVGILFKF
jgi:hypothetical protein